MDAELLLEDDDPREREAPELLTVADPRDREEPDLLTELVPRDLTAPDLEIELPRARTEEVRPAALRPTRLPGRVLIARLSSCLLVMTEGLYRPVP